MHNLILVKPDETHIDELKSIVQEFKDAGDEFHGSSMLAEAECIQTWIENCRLYENKSTLPNPNWVTGEQFLLIQEGETRILGTLNLRHYLNEHLEENGGHIGYSIRPTERKKGLATQMTKLALEICRKQNIPRALLTCNKENEASRRTIEACGGILERESKDGKRLLYWIQC